MSTSLHPCLLSLPVELLYHLLQYLDTETILLSLRYVSRRFYFLTASYRSYHLNLQSTYKSNFYRFCHVINPKHILTLHLSDDQNTPGQISLFLTFFRFNQFDSLRSLTLIDIDDVNLNRILEDLTSISLQQLTIRSRTSVTWTKSTLACLSTILHHSSLKQLTLSIWCFEIHEFLWPNTCSIEYLQISSRITFEQYCTILERCPHLQTLIIKDVLWNNPEVILSSVYPQLKALTVEDNRMDMARIEQFLSLTPSLTYLKVIGMAYLNDLHPWESLLRTKLAHLDRFEFFFLSWKNVNYDLADIRGLIEPYRSPFWLNTKRWIVNCDHILSLNEVMLYTLPICKSQFQYYDASNKVSCSNISTIDANESKLMSNIRELRFNLAKTMVSEDEELSHMSITPQFPQVTQLIIDLDDQCPNHRCQSLSRVIDLSSINQIQLNVHYDFSADRETTETLLDLFRRTTCLHTLDLCNNLSALQSLITIDDLCSIIPTNVKHLKITVKNINEMKRIFDRANHVSSITFQFSFVKSMPSPKVIESLLNIRKDLTYRKDDCTIQVWRNR